MFIRDVQLNFAYQQINQQEKQKERIQIFSSKHLPSYSSTKIIKVINSVNDQMLIVPKTKQVLLQNYHEPTPIYSDTLMPKYMEIQYKNSYQQNIQNQKYTRARSQTGKFKHNQHNQMQIQIQIQSKQSPYISLNMPEFYVQDQFISQLRKLVQNKKQTQPKNKKQIKNKKQPQFKLSEPISYSYDGQIINVKPNKQNNLVSDILTSSASKFIETNQIQKSKPQSALLFKRQTPKKVKKHEPIQFSNVNTLLQQIRLKKGVKIIEEKVILEQKKKQLSVEEIKLALKRAQITKSEYDKAQNIGSPPPPQSSFNPSADEKYEDNNCLKKQSSTLSFNKRSLSQIILPPSKAGLIRVTDKKLKDQYLTQILPYFQQMELSVPIHIIPKTKIDDNDRYNIEYMKSNSMLRKRQTLTPDIRNFGKMSSDGLSNLKSRQKRKNQPQVRLSLRRKFQDKLRL